MSLFHKHHPTLEATKNGLLQTISVRMRTLKCGRSSRGNLRTSEGDRIERSAYAPEVEFCGHGNARHYVSRVCSPGQARSGGGDSRSDQGGYFRRAQVQA